MRLGEYTIRNEIEIHRPVGEVYAFVADPGNDPLWAPLVPEVTRVVGDNHTKDTYRFTQRFGWMRSQGFIEIISESPPTALRGTERVMSSRDNESVSGAVNFSYDLEATGEGTRFVHVQAVRFFGPWRLAHPLMRIVSKRTLGKQLQILKSILEDGHSGRSAQG